MRTRNEAETDGPFQPSEISRLRACLHSRVLMLFLGGLLVGHLAAQPVAAQSVPPEVAAALEEPDLRGMSDVSFLLVRLFRAELFTERGQPFAWSRPFALSLTYARAFSSDLIAWASMMEIERVTPAGASTGSTLETKLASCLPSVRGGDRITGFPLGADAAEFYLNGRKVCEIEHPDFTRLFFGIWLGPQVRDPASAAQLKGEN